MKINLAFISRIGVLLFVVFIDFLGFGIIIPSITPLFLDQNSPLIPSNWDSNLRTIVLGIVTGSYAIAQFFAAPIIGNLSDRYGRKKLLLLTLTGAFIANLAFLLGIIFHNIWVILIGRALGGAMGGNATIANSIIADLSSEKNKSRNFGFIGISIGLGIILGPYLGGMLADIQMSYIIPFLPTSSKIDNITPFFVASVLSIIALLCVYFLLEETLKYPVINKFDFSFGIKDIYNFLFKSDIKFLYLITLLVSLAFQIFVYGINIYLYYKFEYKPNDLGIFLAYAGIWLVISLGIINSIVSTRIKSHKILLISIPILSFIYPAFLVPKQDNTLFYIVPFLAIFYGITQANLVTVISNSTDKKHQGESLGFNQSMQALVEGIVPIVSSWIINYDIHLPLIVSAAAMIIASFIYYQYTFYKK